MSSSSFPAHCPYEDGWGFCPKCQRFYKEVARGGDLPILGLSDKEKEHDFVTLQCPVHQDTLLQHESEAKKRRRKFKHEVSDQGLGLPMWATNPEFYSTPEGLKALEAFRAVQGEIKDRIMTASEGREVTFDELGARRFKKHWFRKGLCV